MSLTKIDDRGLKTPIDLQDNEKIRFGTGNDLAIYHDGSHNYIEDTGTGNLFLKSDSVVSIRGTTIALKNAANTETLLSCAQDGGVTLYHDNSTKFITTSTGARLNGNLVINDGNQLQLQNSVANRSSEIVNTGSNTNSTLSFKTNGSERMLINESGNIGIGGAAPNYQLHATTNIAVGGHGFAQQLTFSNNAIQSLLLGTGYTNMSINALGGNVGIGTSSPVAKFHVHNSGTGSADHAYAYFTTGDTGATASDGLTIGVAANAVAAVNYREAGPLSFGTSSTERMRIDSNGKVGLGTSSPQTPLHVYHATSNESIRCESGDEYVHIVFSDSTTTNEPYIGAQGNNLRAITGGAERMRLNSAGQTLIGTNNTNSCAAKLIVQADSIPSYYANSGGLNVNVTNSNDIHCAELFQGRYNRRVLTHSHSNTGNVTFDVFEQNDSNVGSITGNGSSVAFNTSSDYRLKENIVNLTNGITRLKQLIPRRFNWISDSTNTLVDGFIAHEVSPVIPEAVTGEKDALEENGSIEPQAMDYGKVTPLLTAALQEAIAKIEVLETKVAALEAA